ncbi:hypothetical protein OH76DRAFT_1405233 [Lentinus brumalis]|uniref:Uncharacterized protein n=1 Tax=Lentinus brumalis TaxID=2498619 RepID=A0A371D632_9APHY|nr:hypothetical protein OH76DRAFT_1405233 [Polyporus brumalis]
MGEHRKCGSHNARGPMYASTLGGTFLGAACCCLQRRRPKERSEVLRAPLTHDNNSPGWEKERRLCVGLEATSLLDTEPTVPASSSELFI